MKAIGYSSDMVDKWWLVGCDNALAAASPPKIPTSLDLLRNAFAGSSAINPAIFENQRASSWPGCIVNGYRWLCSHHSYHCKDLASQPSHLQMGSRPSHLQRKSLPAITAINARTWVHIAHGFPAITTTSGFPAITINARNWVHIAHGFPAITTTSGFPAITINVRTWVHLARGYPAIAAINGPGSI